ncbi:nucleotidyltransferase family protein [Aliamphritea spongicola]|uniref:nucleotidyltransferase family protein n=1 Tax=Aliamphritea spongicola TaxID=707589 RepID=UPI00196B678A|nr:nucleotidyltransferase family protein [Aliamphritea spongicola]MBN3560843.1 nucleotidyltransferase family protein [Aliamphritea spongicola]
MQPEVQASARPLGILILAAGNSSRFGSCKLLADCKGQPLINYALRTALAFPRAQTQVVTGAWHAEVDAVMASGTVPRLPLLFNRDWQSGMGSSVALGVSAMAESCSEILILLADQPLVTPEDCRQLLTADKLADICCAEYSGNWGVPALFRSATFASLMQLKGQQGAKKLLSDPAFSVAGVELPRAAQDIDYPRDLNRLFPE